jgi:hypothetical protein
MTHSNIYFYNYNNNDFTGFINQYSSNLPGLTGTTVNSSVDIGPLFDNTNKEVGKIQFNNINIQSITFPPLYNISEEIILELNDGSSIFALNNYKSTTGFYVDGEKYILPIVSCTGSIVTKKGYVVIDVVGDERNLTVKLE